MTVALLTLGDPGRMTGGYLFHQRVADRAERCGAALRFVSIPRLPLPWAIAAGPAWLRNRALGGADVVVVDSIAAAASAPWLGAVRAPIVGMLHQAPGGMDAPRAVRALREPLDRWVYRRAAALMVASEWLRDRLVSEGVAPRRLHVVPPGRDLDAHAAPSADAARGRMRAGRRMAALCVANWLPRKGILELLDAVAALPDDVATLHLVGDPEADRRYAALVRRRLAGDRLRGRVVVHGTIPPAAVAQMYRDADAFLLPSFVEPYGTVWGEAMATGLPVVGWNAANLPYLADHAREALLVPAGDTAALSDAIERLAREPRLRARMGRAAARRAASRPTWDETARAFFEVIADVLAISGRRG